MQPDSPQIQLHRCRAIKAFRDTDSALIPDVDLLEQQLVLLDVDVLTCCTGFLTPDMIVKVHTKCHTQCCLQSLHALRSARLLFGRRVRAPPQLVEETEEGASWFAGT